MRIHIIGVCGTFMGGVARLATELGHTITGSDAHTYPPMSTQLEQLGIELFEGYRAENINENVDLVIVGNSISRGNPELEWVLDRNLRFTSGAQWLSEYVLADRWVIAVAGTHGKTTTSSMVAWILEVCGYEPGFLIGGVPSNFGESARLGNSDFFVMEADEYDTAFSDKRSKFIHYRPRTLILNNLEFDHADIFDSLDAIKTQFHHLIRTLASSALVLHQAQDNNLDDLLSQGCWSEQQSFGTDIADDWHAKAVTPDCRTIGVTHNHQIHTLNWALLGRHNMLNALAAIAATHHVGVPVDQAVLALSDFLSVKRRLEQIYQGAGVTVYDDFAHHPTAIAETTAALRAHVGSEPVFVVLEPRSNTMKQGVHKDTLKDAWQPADQVWLYADESLQWQPSALASDTVGVFSSTETLLEDLLTHIERDMPCHIVVMSNGGFQGFSQRLVQQLTNRKLM